MLSLSGNVVDILVAEGTVTCVKFGNIIYQFHSVKDVVLTHQAPPKCVCDSVLNLLFLTISWQNLVFASNFTLERWFGICSLPLNSIAWFSSWWILLLRTYTDSVGLLDIFYKIWQTTIIIESSWIIPRFELYVKLFFQFFVGTLFTYR